MEKSRKIKIVASGIAITLIVGGWLFYGINAYNSSQSVIFKKFIYKTEKDFNEQIDKIKINKENKLTYNYKINETNKVLGIYNNLNTSELYIFNDNEYYDIAEELKKFNINLNNKNVINKDNYKIIFKSILESFQKNESNIKMTKKTDKDNKKYIYNYSLNKLTPIIETLKTNRNFIKILKDTYQLKEEDIFNILNLVKDKNINLSIYITGKKYEIVSYVLKIDNLFSLKVSDNYISGFIMDVGFFYDNDLTILSEEYQIDLLLNDDINVDKSKRNKLKLFNLAEFMGIN